MCSPTFDPKIEQNQQVKPILREVEEAYMDMKAAVCCAQRAVATRVALLLQPNDPTNPMCDIILIVPTMPSAKLRLAAPTCAT
jgi:hypothetical protein